MSGKFGNKIEAVDFVINCLQEHEKKLDYLVERLEVIAEFMEKHATRLS